MVRQRGKNDCVIAAVANAVGTSYAAVKRICGSCRGGLENHEIRWLLSEFGAWKETRCRKMITLESFLKRNPAGKYVVSQNQMGWLFGCDHAIAIVDGVVLGEYNPTHPIDIYWKMQESA